MTQEVLKQALEALETSIAITMPKIALRNEAILALREALAQPQQEPVAWMELLREAKDNCKASIVEEGISASRKEYRIDLEARLTAALYTSPPPQRKPLTDEEIYYMYNEPHSDAEMLEFARAIEAAHGIKE